MPKRIHAIVNPVSGRSRGDRALNQLFRSLNATASNLTVQFTQGPGDARRIGREACEAGAELIIVAGGDGTVSEVVSGMIAPGVPILIAPRGTENVLAKYLGLRLDGDRLAEVARNGREQAIDIGLANGRLFLLVAGVGFDAEVVRRVHAARKGHIDYGAYFWPLWRTFWSYRHPRFRVEVDGEPIFEGAGLAMAGNIPRYAMGLRILREARPDDGLMDVCVFACESRSDLIYHAIWTAIRTLGTTMRTSSSQVKTLMAADLPSSAGRQGVIYRQGRCVRITPVGIPFGPVRKRGRIIRGRRDAGVEPADAPGVVVELDGDPGCELNSARPLDLEVVPRGARFIVPESWQP